MNSLRSKVVSVALSIATLLALAPSAVHAAAHAVGTNVNASGTIWMVRDNGSGGMCRQAYTSEGAFLSYGFNSWAGVVTANADDLALAVCAQSFIPPQDGSIIVSDRDDTSAVKGTAFIISGGNRIGITSEPIFLGLGYKWSNSSFADVSWMAMTGTLSSATQQHPAGTRVNNGGTIQYVGATSLLGFPTESVFFSWGYQYKDVVPANAADRSLPQVGIVQARQAGQLSPSLSSVPPPPPSTGSSVNVSGANLAPASTMAKGAQSVRVMDFVFTAPSNGAISISSLVIHRSGVGSTSDIANAYIYEGNNRLSSGRTFNSSTNDATFALNVQIAAGSSKTLSLLISFSATATTGAAHMFGLEAASSVNATGAAVTGSFPIRSNTMTISGTSAGTLTLTKTGSISNPRVGDLGVKVSEITLAATTEDALLNNITFSQGGNIANSALNNCVLKQSGVAVTNSASIGSNSRLVLSFVAGSRIDRGNSRIYELYCDVGGRPADTIIFYVEEGGDLQATGGTFGTGMTTVVTAMDTTAEGHTLTLQGGQFTITFTGPSSRNISNSANDVSVWEGTIFSANAVEVRNWRVRVQDTNATNPDLADTAATAAIQDVKIWNADNNTVLAGPKELTAAADLQDETLVMADTVNLAAGSTTKIKITVDVRNTPSNITLLVSLAAFGANDIKNTNSNTFLTPATDISPNSNIPGNNQTVTAAALAISTAPSPTDQTIVKGVADKEVTAFNFVVGSGDSVKINSITVTGGISDTDDNAYGAAGAADGATGTLNGLVLSAKLMVGTTQIGTSKSFSSGTATFDNLNRTIAASQTEKVSVVISTNSAATLGGGNDDFLRFSLAASSVTAVDGQGNTVTATGLAANAAGAAGDVVVDVAATGSLNATLAATPTNPAPGLMVAGTTDKVFSAFKFSAANDSFLVKKFVLLPYVGGANSAASNDRIAQLKVRYKNQAGTIVTQNVGLSGTSNNVDISANPMYVAVNTDSTLEVLGDLAFFTLQNGTEDENITFALKGVDATNNQATGLGSNSDVTTFSATDLLGNAQYIYRTNLSVAKSGNAPDGTNRARSSDQIVAAHSFSSTAALNNSSSYFRGSKKAPDGSATGWTATGGGTAATITSAGNFISGSSAITTGAGTANTAGTVSFDFGASAGLNNHNRLAGWVKITLSAGASTATLSFDDTAALASPQGSSAAITADGTWQYVDFATTGADANTRYVGITYTAAGAGNTVTVTVDDMRFYNDSVTETVTGTFAATAVIKGLVFTMKDSGGTVRMYGSYNGTGGVGGTGTVVMIPGDGADVSVATTYSDVEVTPTTALVLDTRTNTATLMLADTTANEPLSVSVTTGTPTSAGSFRWYDNSDTAAGNNQAGITVVLPISTTLDFSNNY